MYNKKDNKKKIIIEVITIITTIIFLLTISLYIERDGSKYNGLNNISASIQKIIMYPLTHLAHDNSNNETESYTIQKNVNESLEKEIKELKETLDLNRTLTEYKPINATILSRNKSYWFNTLTIDKGTKSGIKKGMAVITKKGLIGKINKVYKNSSEIKLITSDDIKFKVSIAIKTNNQDNFAIMNGYDIEKGLIKATGIDKTTVINKGDEVLTSGLGELFPTGIFIGNVEEIESDKYNLSKTVYIKTKQDFSDIHYVTVLKVTE